MTTGMTPTHPDYMAWLLEGLPTDQDMKDAIRLMREAHCDNTFIQSVKNNQVDLAQLPTNVAVQTAIAVGCPLKLFSRDTDRSVADTLLGVLNDYSGAGKYLPALGLAKGRFAYKLLNKVIHHLVNMDDMPSFNTLQQSWPQVQGPTRCALEGELADYNMETHEGTFMDAWCELCIDDLGKAARSMTSSSTHVTQSKKSGKQIDYEEDGGTEEFRAEAAARSVGDMSLRHLAAVGIMLTDKQVSLDSVRLIMAHHITSPTPDPHGNPIVLENPRELRKVVHQGVMNSGRSSRSLLLHSLSEGFRQLLRDELKGYFTHAPSQDPLDTIVKGIRRFSVAVLCGNHKDPASTLLAVMGIKPSGQPQAIRSEEDAELYVRRVLTLLKIGSGDAIKGARDVILELFDDWVEDGATFDLLLRVFHMGLKLWAELMGGTDCYMNDRYGRLDIVMLKDFFVTDIKKYNEDADYKARLRAHVRALSSMAPAASASAGGSDTAARLEIIEKRMQALVQHQEPPAKRAKKDHRLQNVMQAEGEEQAMAIDECTCQLQSVKNGLANGALTVPFIEKYFKINDDNKYGRRRCLFMDIAGAKVRGKEYKSWAKWCNNNDGRECRQEHAGCPFKFNNNKVLGKVVPEFPAATMAALLDEFAVTSEAPDRVSMNPRTRV